MAESVLKQVILEEIMRAGGSDFLLKAFMVDTMSVCDPCFVSMEKALLPGRKGAWEKLPAIFQCQSCEE
jgi:hypothetical protein